MSDVYIGGTTTLSSKLESASSLADQYYPRRACSAYVNTLAQRVSGSFGIRERAVCIDLSRIPEKVLRSADDHPLEWCSSIVEELTEIIPIHEIGYLAVAYNTSMHRNTLPSLASQVAMRTGINPQIEPQEFSNYGCAAGFFPLQSAVQYCRSNQKAAIVIVFDQCSSRASFCYDEKHEMFKMDLKGNLLFSDGAAGVLLIPERLRTCISRSLPKVQDIQSAFKLSDVIRFEDARFILGDSVSHFVPPLVAATVIKPVLARNGLTAREVSEWSIHQGSRNILARFANPDILGLSDKQLGLSKECFENFGNMSAPSCFVVLDAFLKRRRRSKRGTSGMVVGFGAGLYLASLLYCWD